MAWANAGGARPGDPRLAPATRRGPVESLARRHHRRTPDKPHIDAPPLGARHHPAARALTSPIVEHPAIPEPSTGD
ncbi:hypothetical protein FF36_02422 [Frankia torreyi]|uniref:Uncharacterized protein n=1 Tax=Frankia torreyi TaxID=1856 RepID=A0A0D8BGY4_9ACTN|nr:MULTISPECIES: hypothetical protein [Frankia]KJE23219.1 hypothetical protein FF36_02422 [Frankia torreyi]KQC39480.1 hypothetical protein UK82_04910 [Frankia sp. ACN1ag]KQM06522.1 hypothetical protein FF86_1008105 [Frankia sp. CpI1-P]